MVPRWVLLWLLVVPVALGVWLCGPGAWWGVASVDPRLRWMGLALVLLAIFVLAGWALRGFWYAIFVGKGTNTWSLSITQALLWTVIVVPAVLAIVLDRLYHGRSDPLSVLVDNDFYLYMGLPVASLAGAGMITSAKYNSARTIPKPSLDKANVAFLRANVEAIARDYANAEDINAKGLAEATKAIHAQFEQPPLKQPATVAQLTSAAGQQVGSDDGRRFLEHAKKYVEGSVHGVMRVNLDGREARPTDMLTGAEAGDSGATDFGRVQYLLVSLLAMAFYVLVLLDFLGTHDGICVTLAPCGLPPAQGAFAAILLTSTVGYLGLKGVANTPSQ